MIISLLPAQRVYTGSTGHTSYFSHQSSTGSEKAHADSDFSASHQPGYGQFSTGACAYPPDTEDTPFEQFSDEDVDRSESFSG